MFSTRTFLPILAIIVQLLVYVFDSVSCQDIVGCGGFVQSTVPLNFERVEVKLHTKQGALKFKTECAPKNGYFLVAVYDKGEYTLKINPPNGWSFDPTEISLNIDGKTDPCVKGQDINFKFTGFSVNGLIGSKGRPLGPAGVEVQLKAQDPNDNSVLVTLIGEATDDRKNVTTDGGIFSFTNVMPGAYKVFASHPVWTLQQSTTSVVVKDDNIYSDKELMVSGYDVKGHVLSAGEPIQGVMFLMFSDDVQPGDLSGCKDVPETLMDKLGRKVNQPKVCAAISGEDGVFVFPSVPSGDYALVPYYSSRDITFDVVPTKITFKVNYKSVMLKTPFQVHGFSVTGKVIDFEGRGMPGVSVVLGKDGKSATTNSEGGFLMENVTSGTYQIKASFENTFFDVTEAHINPNSPQIPEIQVKRFSLCGKVEIVNLPPGILQSGQRKVMLLRNGSQNADMVTASTDEFGKFCFEVAPGVYRIEALISPSEAKLGLMLTPPVVEVPITNSPVLDIMFKQFLATLSGSLTCIGSCDDSKVVMSSVERPGQEKQHGLIQTTEQGTTFTFKNVLPGKYKLSPIREKWCWEPRFLEVDVRDADIQNIQFNHVGFLLKCVISHNVTLNFSLEGSSEQVGSFGLKMGKNKFCLKAPGIYSLTPISCYNFDQERYMFDTSSPKELALSAVGYRLAITVQSQKKLNDISVSVRSMRRKTEETISLTLAESDVVQDLENNNNTKSEKPQETFEYQGVYWARLNEEVQVTAKSSEVLFHPSSKTVTVLDKCPGASVEFIGKEGIFVQGTLTPKLKDVMITVKTLATETHKESKTLFAMTDENGFYSLGPMHSDIQYEVTAAKEGYIINEGSSKGDFVAMKLGKITAEVVDEKNETMQGVLLSLSGVQYRSNTLTPKSGQWSFANLSPGQYFLRPMQKEYSFEPNSQTIDVKEGEEVMLNIKGKRVAFSFLGVVTTLAGDPEKSITVEATGLESCSDFQEESVTDAEGKYRLRGLQPNCDYSVKVKVGDSNPEIERAGPSNRTIKVGTADINDVNFIVFYKPRSFELTATIDTDKDWLSSLKVLLYREDNLDSPLHAVSPGHAKFVTFPALPLDSQFYVVRLESTLNKQRHIIDSTSASFTTGGSFKKHVDLKFSVKKKKVEMEATKSVITLPLAIALMVLVYNYAVVMATLSRVSDYFKGQQQQQDQSDSFLEDSSRGKKKRR